MAPMDFIEQQASTMWRVSPDLVCFFDADGTFSAVNPAWERTLGWPEEDMIGAPFLRFVHPDDAERSEQAFAQLLTGKPVLRFENRYVTMDGAYRWLSWVAVQEGDRFFAAARDFTKDRENVDLVASQGAEADLREQFLAVLGHDLRNPLAALDSGISILERRSTQEELMPVLGQMRTSVKRMDELIRNMMDFARVRLGDGIGLERAEHSAMGERLRNVTEEIALVSPELDIAFENLVDRPITCDAARIEQVLSNLLANAVTHGDLSQPISVTICTGPSNFCIDVANGGEAMGEEARANLFRPFFRGSPEESKQGLGLGLFIVSEIVSAHGGTIEVTSDAKGTKFALEMPG